MLCQKCGKAPATVHFTEVKNKQKTESHLCGECSKSHPNYISSPSLSYSANELLGSLLQTVANKVQQEERKIKCKNCGLSFYDFQQKGQFGCARDYRAFKPQLKALLKHIHGTDRHVGKIPPSLRRWRELAACRKKLHQAIEAENYEEAAKLRDKIKELERHATN